TREAEPRARVAFPTRRSSDLSCSGGIQLRDERIGAADRERRLEGAGRRGEVCRTGPPCHIRVAQRVHRDAETHVKAAAAEIGGINGSAHGWTQLSDERIMPAA